VEKQLIFVYTYIQGHKQERGYSFNMKKLLMLLVAVMLVLAPSGFADHADAKGYKSGKKSFNSNTAPTNTQTPTKGDSNVNASTNKGTTSTPATTAPTKSGGFMSGGFMKGLLVGGLAGMLFGGLFGDMGALGAIFGFLINMLAIVAVIVLIRKIFVYFKTQREKKQELNSWKR